MKVIGLVGVPTGGSRREISTMGEITTDKTGKWA